MNAIGRFIENCAESIFQLNNSLDDWSTGNPFRRLLYGAIIGFEIFAASFAIVLLAMIAVSLMVLTVVLGFFAFVCLVKAVIFIGLIPSALIVALLVGVYIVWE